MNSDHIIAIASTGLLDKFTKTPTAQQAIFNRRLLWPLSAPNSIDVGRNDPATGVDALTDSAAFDVYNNIANNRMFAFRLAYFLFIHRNGN